MFLLILAPNEFLWYMKLVQPTFVKYLLGTECALPSPEAESEMNDP